jgi:hypothetical protein
MTKRAGCAAILSFPERVHGRKSYHITTAGSLGLSGPSAPVRFSRNGFVGRASALDRAYRWLCLCSADFQLSWRRLVGPCAHGVAAAALAVRDFGHAEPDRTGLLFALGLGTPLARALSFGAGCFAGDVLSRRSSGSAGSQPPGGLDEDAHPSFARVGSDDHSAWAGLKACLWAGNAGWGGRVRTCEWRHQKPLPYHLATPQHFRPANAGCAPLARLSARGKPVSLKCPKGGGAHSHPRRALRRLRSSAVRQSRGPHRSGWLRLRSCAAPGRQPAQTGRAETSGLRLK